MHIEEALGLIRQIPNFPKPDVLFQDITPLLSNSEGFSAVISGTSDLSPDANVVAGIEARGFIFASAIANHKRIGFVPLRKAGKLPYSTHSREYGLEYGQDRLEIHKDAFNRKSKVLLVDDVLATGGTIVAALELIEDAGGLIQDVAVIIEIRELAGREKIESRFPGIRLHSLMAI